MGHVRERKIQVLIDQHAANWLPLPNINNIPHSTLYLLIYQPITHPLIHQSHVTATDKLLSISWSSSGQEYHFFSFPHCAARLDAA